MAKRKKKKNKKKSKRQDGQIYNSLEEAIEAMYTGKDRFPMVMINEENRWILDYLFGSEEECPICKEIKEKGCK